MKGIYYFITLLALSSCAAKKPYIKSSETNNNNFTSFPISNIDYELYLVGDIGASNKNVSQSNIVDLIKHELIKNDINKSVVFLGNSFNQKGLPDVEDPGFKEMDQAISNCIKQLKDHTDKVFFIPGNTEWYDGQNYTVSALQQVEGYIESKVGGKNIFVPSHGCAEPKVVELSDDLILVLIDSQWVLQGDKSMERTRSGCDVDNEEELVTALQDILAGNKMKNVVFAAHHPVYSNGAAGGNKGLKSHLLPLPILGSVITGLNKINGGQQRIGHPQYEAYRAVIQQALSNFEGVIHVAAHDKNLQYHSHNDHHFVVAGSGSTSDYVRKGAGVEFAYMKTGFSKIVHTKDNELWLEFYAVGESNSNEAEIVFQKRLYKKEIIDFDDEEQYPDLEMYPKTVKVVPSKNYTKKILGMGESYRKEWGTEVEAPVLLLDQFEDGLKPVQQGGGFQTKSLRLENPEGRQWVIRTVDKDLSKLIPPALRGTYAQKIAQDGISTSNPFGAYAVPVMAEAAGIYHANPKYVWVPQQEALGDYNPNFANKLYLFEERPGGNMSGHSSYGGAIKSVNTPKLISKLLKNHKHVVDQEFVLRARLFDILIGDWDRHGDQWRWGVYEDPSNDDVTLYRAIPRDRDQVFFKNDGILNFIASRPYFNPPLRKFDHKVDHFEGLEFNARHFDRHFLAQLNKVTFEQVASDIQTRVTDEVIDQAFKAWPKAVYKHHGDEIKSKIKSRRNDLVKYAQQLYQHITKEVTVIGTNGKNIFDITTLPEDKLKVEVYHLDKKTGNQLIWSRVINGSDCKELRLYGLKKADIFSLNGENNSSIKIRIVGGSGDDIVTNKSSHLKIYAYDRTNGISLSGKKINNKTSDQKGINRFDRLDWKIDRTIQFIIPSFYTDEGIGINYNRWWIRNGFRKNPYKSNHKLSLGYYFANKAAVARYTGDWVSVFGQDWGFKLAAEFTGPTFAQLFYGLGNSYINYEDVFPSQPDANTTAFHIIRGIHLDINPHFIRDLNNNRFLSINPTIEYINYDNTLDDPLEERFIFTNEAGRTSRDFGRKLYTGLGIHYTTSRINNATIPTRGYNLKASIEYRQSLTDSEYGNVTFSTDIAAYIPLSPAHKVVLATNFGAAQTLGNYEFFHANYLSNASRLRGYRINRFAGDALLYQSTDLRVKLLQGKGGLKAGLGIYGSFDYGRVFLEEELNANDWHTSYGGGIYFTPLDLFGFKIGYHKGNSDSQLTIGGALSF